MPCNPSPRGTNETRRSQDGSALAADVAESTGNSVPPGEAAPQRARPRVKVDMPIYSGYQDSKSTNEYLDRLLYYQQATGLSDAELIAHMVPVSLTEQAAQWL
ncbi:hypothetical protein HPB50_029464 [Hyalomma asiaticum]|nr:hypothetical protein HPB50_029464 [Hyalomma asiaticum]